MQRTASTTAATAMIALVGCQSVDPAPQLEAVRTLNESRSGQEIVWEQDEQGAAMIRSRVDELLADGLSRDDAAAIAVLNNRSLQASYENLGLAAADVVQASLPQNPTLDGVIAMPFSPGNAALTLSAWLSDSWIIPARTRLAEFGAQASQYDVAADALQTAHDAMLAWDGLVAARESLKIESELLGVRRDEAERLEILYSHGLYGTIELETARAAHVDQQMAARMAQQRLTEAQTHLDVALSLEDAAARVPESATLDTAPGEASADLAAQLETAMAERLDLKASRAVIDASTEELELQRWLVWRSVSVGVGYVGDFDGLTSGANSIGPTFTVEIPIFDQNQAGIASGAFRLRQAIKQHAALQSHVRQDVIDSVSQTQTARKQLTSLEGDLEQAADRELDYADRWNKRMQVTYLEVLAARAGRLDVQRRIVTARRRLRRAELMQQMAVVGRTADVVAMGD